MIASSLHSRLRHNTPLLRFGEGIKIEQANKKVEKWEMELHDSQRRGRVKYVHESCGTRNQELLYWRRPAAIYLTDRERKERRR
jgi:hypothetical protein